jgi:hypothetical protein
MVRWMAGDGALRGITGGISPNCIDWLRATGGTGTNSRGSRFGQSFRAVDGWVCRRGAPGGSSRSWVCATGDGRPGRYLRSLSRDHYAGIEGLPSGNRKWAFTESGTDAVKVLGRRLRQLEDTLGPEVKPSLTDTPVLPRLTQTPFDALTTTDQ